MIFLARWHWVRRGGLGAALALWLLIARTIARCWTSRTTPLIPLLCWTVGMACNGLVILANGGRMPTTAPFSRAIWTGADDSRPKRLAWLGDCLHVGNRWASIGDCFILAGTVALVAECAYRALRPKKPAPAITGSGSINYQVPDRPHIAPLSNESDMADMTDPKLMYGINFVGKLIEGDSLE